MQTEESEPENEHAWLDDAKAALGWFIETIGPEEWTVRRGKVVRYFNDLVQQQYSGRGIEGISPEKPFRPLALYDDWMAWYMYLVESLRDRPTCDEPMQSARIHPFFSAIGRNINSLKSAYGIENRIQSLLCDKQNQPDSTLYELVVASAYFKNGWIVEFVDERAPEKNADLIARKNNQEVYVECKRFAKTTGYSESERQKWLLMWRPLSDILQSTHRSTHVEVIFKKPLDSLPINYLARLFVENYTPETVANEKDFETEDIIFTARHIDMQAVNRHFEDYHVRDASPQLISLLAGNYDPFGNYTYSIAPTAVSALGPDDGLHACNVFVDGIRLAFSAKWACIAPESIDAKAKDVTKTLSKAVRQLPASGISCIHIGYETLDGPIVEFARHNKITEIVNNFNFGDKNIHSIFFNAFQPLTKIDGFECAETTAYYSINGQDSHEILNDMLLLGSSEISHANTTHWAQDIETQLKQAYVPNFPHT